MKRAEMSKMFGLILGLFMLVPTVSMATTVDDHPCKKAYNNWAIRVNQDDYTGAYPFWHKMLKECGEDLKSCPCIDKDNLAIGIYMFGQLITGETDETHKRMLIDSLYQTYDWSLDFFGEDADLMMRYGVDIMRYDYNAKSQKAYDLLKKSVELGGDQASSYAIQGYFRMAYALFRKQLEGKDCDWLITIYFDLSDRIATQKANGADAEVLDPIQAEMDGYAEYCLGCEQLVPMVESKLESIPEECEAATPILEKYINLLDSKGCTDSEVFKKLSMRYYECNKTHEAAYNIAITKMREKKNSEALSYIKDAIDMCGGCESTCKYYKAAAQIYNSMGNVAQAKAYGEKMVACGNNEGYMYYAYYYISNKTCGSTGLERKSVYWLGSDYMEKAGRGADYYKNQYPTQEELFDAGISEGSTFSVSCWGMTTTVRKR